MVSSAPSRTAVNSANSASRSLRETTRLRAGRTRSSRTGTPWAVGFSSATAAPSNLTPCPRDPNDPLLCGYEIEVELKRTHSRDTMTIACRDVQLLATRRRLQQPVGHHRRRGSLPLLLLLPFMIQ